MLFSAITSQAMVRRANRREIRPTCTGTSIETADRIRPARLAVSITT